MQGLNTTLSCLRVIRLVFESLTVNVDTLVKSFTPELFAADEAIELARKGVPFRDAYLQVGMNIDKLAGRDPRQNILSKTHQGAPGNLGLDQLRQHLAELASRLGDTEKRIQQAKQALLEA